MPDLGPGYVISHINRSCTVLPTSSSGFRRIPPFGEYREDPLSRFYEKRL